MRRGLLIAVAVLSVLTAFYFFWLRDSSLVRVERVTVTGLDTRDAPRLRAALAVSARSMTTLHVDREKLLESVSGYPVVRDLRVESDFPHALRIVVIQHTPAAIAVSDGLRIPVAGDGTLLRGVPVEGRLPTIDVRGQVRHRAPAQPRRPARGAGARRRARGAQEPPRGRSGRQGEGRDG